MKSLLLLALLGATAQAAVIDPMPYHRLDEYGEIKISPNGDYYAVTVPMEDRTLLAVMRASDRKITASIGLGQYKHVHDFWWVNPERVMISVAQRIGTQDFPSLLGQLNAINVDGTRAEALVGQMTGGPRIGSRVSSKKGDRVAALLVDDLPNDDKFAIIQTMPFQADPHSKIERMDVYTGRRAALGRAPVRNATFSADNAGVVRLVYGFNADRYSRLFHRANDEAEWTEIGSSANSDHAEFPIGFSADNRLAYLRSTDANGPDAIVELDLATMKRRTLLQDKRANPARILYRAGTNVPVGVEYDDAGHRMAFFDPTTKEARLHRSLAAAFPGHGVRVTSQTTDGGRAIVHVWSDRSPGDDYLFDLKTMKADHLLTSRAWLDPETQAARTPVEVKARDGLPLHGYVTVPHGTGGKGLPMVVMPHGGPFGIYDGWGFDADAQMLAAAGYAVLQVNFRGSGNYGMAFEHAGRNQWGKAMQDDVTDATKWAIDQGIADPKRICIHGGSYGAYAALMGAAREPALYRCASGYVGVYDLPAMHTSGDIRDSDSGDTYLQRWIGKPEELAGVSPNRLADKIKVPVLLASGGEDRRAPSTHTDMMERALKSAGVPVQRIHYPEEGHGFYQPRHQQEYYTTLLEFLDRHIGGGAGKPAP